MCESQLRLRLVPHARFDPELKRHDLARAVLLDHHARPVGKDVPGRRRGGTGDRLSSRNADTPYQGRRRATQARCASWKTSGSLAYHSEPGRMPARPNYGSRAQRQRPSGPRIINLPENRALLTVPRLVSTLLTFVRERQDDQGPNERSDARGREPSTEERRCGQSTQTKQ